jgi:hypothetical protein
MDFATATTQPAADSVESDCNPTQAWQGRAWLGMARRGSDWHGRHGEAWQGAAGEARLGAARPGMARQARRG